MRETGARGGVTGVEIRKSKMRDDVRQAVPGAEGGTFANRDDSFRSKDLRGPVSLPRRVC